MTPRSIGYRPVPPGIYWAIASAACCGFWFLVGWFAHALTH